MTEDKAPVGTDKTEPDNQTVAVSGPVSQAIAAEPALGAEDVTKSQSSKSEGDALSLSAVSETARTKPRGFMRRMIVRSPAAAIHPETVPEPPQHVEQERKERPLTNFLSGLLSFIAIFAACLAGLFLLAERQIYAPGPLENDKVVLVRGSTSEVIDRLEREGVVDKAFLLTLYWQLTGRASQIKGGEYQFKKQASLDQVTTTLIEGKTIKHSLTIAEGKTSQEIIELLLADSNLAGEIKDIPKEGTLLPETYKFDFGMARSKLIDHMTQEQMKLVREIWAKRDPDLPLASPQDLVILASIVEKETGKADERPRVAGVFVNRLLKKMLDQVTTTLIEGKTIKHSLTIAEGKTSQEIIELLLADSNLAGEIKDIPKEGTLLPETYKFDFGMARSKLIDHMTQEQMKLVREIWAKRDPDLPLASPQDLVILASIVEKETGKADERPRVAGVFVNRLLKKMRLESDPTVVYGLVGGKGSLGRGLTKAELEQSTPYNTYTLPGLPAGPITNPGRAALEAVANPSRTKDLFFVADGTGGHVFAETYEQHLKNVAKWRQIEGQKSESAPSVATPAAPANTTSKSTAASDTPDASKTPTTSPSKTATPTKAPAKPVKKKATTPDGGADSAAAPD